MEAGTRLAVPAAGFGRNAGLSWRPRDLERSPFFVSVAPVLARLPAASFPSLDDLNALAHAQIVSGGGARIRFVPPGVHDRSFESRSFELNYEIRIHREGAVATREKNLHDLFNALAWLRFPLAKAALNRSHHRHLLAAAHGEEPGAGLRGGKRGASRDALTLFDESGVLVASSSPRLLELLRGFRWRALFVEHRAEVIASLRVFVLGHAILEKAVAPYPGLTGRALLLDVDAAFFGASPDAQVAELDRRAARWVASRSESGAADAVSPLPLLGLPGWCEENVNPAYYEDTTQFRAGRTRLRQA